jgi:hypothetical protein
MGNLFKRARILTITLSLFSLLTAGNHLPALFNPTLPSIFVQTAEAATTPSPTAQPIPEQPGELQACPPAVINGVIGNGSPDYPFVTGTQSKRIFRNSVESTCGETKVFPGFTDEEFTFKYDSFTFNNPLFQPVCVTVITTAGGANQILTAAYRGSFDPSNVQENYIGDAGNSDKVRSFSFLLPGRGNFVIVQSRVNNASNPTSLAYSFRVLGLPGCDSCPPAEISGLIGSGSPDYPATIDTQTGRLFRNAVASTCDAPKTVPSVEDPATQFSYDAYTFLNTSVSTRCVTVDFTAGGANQLLVAAYLNRFNPFDVQENYLADAGNSNQVRTISFNVPGRRSFVIVVSRVNTAANPTSLAYNFGISGLPGCDCSATLNKIDASFPATGGTGTVNVTMPAGCSWSVDTFNSPFINITAGATGSGNGTVSYTVAPHTGANRRLGVIAIAGKSFTIFQGIQFNDVPVGAPFYNEIGKLSARNITSGCSTGNYCPNDPVTREQMAAFILRSLGQFSLPIPTQQRFNDVPPSSPFYAFVDQMAVRQISLGCSSNPPLYCPGDVVTREQMAAFLIRALGEFNPPTPPSQRFSDVPTTSPFYKFVDRMAVLGITSGCSANPPLYCPGATVTRGQMAVFLTKAFNL